ncbi:hypothetical protein QC763_0087940 [Podospora pseudopauciseta]|uniref:Zn(2)-C6 fungal-type domain-containing protein n=1 Tax=Podospora pseudopauciseta TaxID=2093780 RepID=A0ABR0H3H4_9PEZI|nr:hypothetical protein QC763_0087940 [Podospora pseudopauciseta]
MVHRPAATEKMSPSNSPGNPPAATSGSKSRAGANAEPPLRRLLPTSRPPARAGSEIEIPRRRRTYTTAACEACRERKAKCNAERPSCAYCVNADIPCVYDTSARNETHSQALKRKFGELEARAAVYVELYELLQDRSDIESAEIFKRIRMGGPPESILRRIKEGDLLLQLSLKPEMRFRYVSHTLASCRLTCTAPTIPTSSLVSMSGLHCNTVALRCHMHQQTHNRLTEKLVLT